MHSKTRIGTRVKCDISVKLDVLNSPHLPSEPCLIVFATLQGCGVQLDRPLEIGTRVRLQGLPTNRNVMAQVVNCISLGDYEKFWLIGLALDEPGNVWGIERPPKDWEH